MTPRTTHSTMATKRAVSAVRTTVAARLPHTPPATPQADAQRASILTDTFGRFHDYLRISITERCNLRCQYCMPEKGIDLTPDNDLLSTDEIMRLATVFAGLGVKKIRLTGGEPLVRRDFDVLASHLAKLQQSSPLEKVCITTNGINLTRKLPILRANKINYINISLDTLEDHKFEFVTRRRGFTKVMRAMHQCMDEPQFTTKVNCVVMRGINDEEVANFARLAQTHPVEVRFIEYMPFGGNNYKKNMLVPWMESFDAIEKDLDCKLHPIMGKRGDVSKRFAATDWKGSIGFITTMTSKFCGSCNRMRLLADGQLKVCLFDSNEGSLLQV